MRNPAKTIRRGFTLIEMVTSVAITTILLLAIGSAMVLTGKALPNPQSASGSVLTGANATDKIATELQYATYFTERTSKAITFLIPDRDADGKAEIVRYAWSGVAGDPLTRKLNSGTPTTVVSSVKALEFTFDLASETEKYPGPFADQPEQLLASYWPTGTFSSNDLDVKEDDFPGQYFVPTLPANAQSWSVTRMQFKSRKAGTGQQDFYAMLYAVNGSRQPSGTAIQSLTMTEPSSTSFTTMEATYTAVTGRTPGSGLCFLLKGTSISALSGEAQYGQGGGGGLTRVQINSVLFGLLSDTDISISNSNTLLYQAYGKVNMSTFDQSLTRKYVTAIGISMQAGGDASSRIDTRVAMLNRPELLSGYWTTSFDSNPTAIDSNGDGSADWRCTGTFDPSTLSTSVWSADRTLDTNPSNAFGKFTTIETRFEDASTSGNGVTIELRVESTGATYGSIDATLTKASGTQTLVLRTRELLVVPQTLLTITGIASGPVSVRFDIDPATDSVSLTVNDLAYGKFTYKHVVGASDGVVRLYPQTGETGGRFDEVTIRVSE